MEQDLLGVGNVGARENVVNKKPAAKVPMKKPAAAVPMRATPSPSPTVSSLVLGCSRCRRSPKGCAQCKDPSYGGAGGGFQSPQPLEPFARCSRWGLSSVARFSRLRCSLCAMFAIQLQPFSRVFASSVVTVHCWPCSRILAILKCKVGREHVGPLSVTFAMLVMFFCLTLLLVE